MRKEGGVVMQQECGQDDFTSANSSIEVSNDNVLAKDDVLFGLSLAGCYQPLSFHTIYLYKPLATVLEAWRLLNIVLNN